MTDLTLKEIASKAGVTVAQVIAAVRAEAADDLGEVVSMDQAQAALAPIYETALELFAELPTHGITNAQNRLLTKLSNSLPTNYRDRLRGKATGLKLLQEALKNG